jgi:hypothetical protein
MRTLLAAFFLLAGCSPVAVLPGPAVSFEVEKVGDKFVARCECPKESETVASSATDAAGSILQTILSLIL